MEVLYPKCAGLDVHKDVVVACARIAADGKVTQDVRSFATTTTALFELSAWLEEQQCTHVVMEATGVYWKPVWHVLEGTFELMLANAQHVRNVPGRKSDVNDAMWLSDLLAHGLVRGSFVPPTPIQEVRDLTRTRKQLGREVAQHTNRIQKVLEDTNIKIASVIFILRYLEDETFQRRIGLQLNKGEALHGLRNFLFLANQGQIRRGVLEDQTNQAQCLNLVTNAVVLWNTVYMSAALDELRAAGHRFTDDDVVHLSPARFEHINPYGRYHFDPELAKSKGPLRPLRRS